MAHLVRPRPFLGRPRPRPQRGSAGAAAGEILLWEKPAMTCPGRASLAADMHGFINGACTIVTPHFCNAAPASSVPLAMMGMLGSKELDL